MDIRDELMSVLEYHPDSGLFFWKRTVSPRGVAGSIAGCHGHHHVEIRYAKQGYMAHRVAWLFIHGRWPEAFIDHINRDGYDNRLCNLREATPRQNQGNRGVSRNTRSGIKGVQPSGKKWVAFIRKDGASKYLGTFASKEEASAAYFRVAVAIHGDFACA